MRRSLPVLAILAAACMAAPARAQQPATTPEAATQQYFAAMRASDWHGVAALMHSEGLGQLRDSFRVLAAADSASPALAALLGVRTRAELEALTPVEAHARMLEGLARLSPEMRQAMTSMHADVIGHVAEGPDVVHVVYRLRAGVSDASMSKTSVHTLKRSGNGWLALPTGDVQGMMESLVEAMLRRRESLP